MGYVIPRFLPYLTVFQSRLGIINVMNDVIGDNRVRNGVFQARLKKTLFANVRITDQDAMWPMVARYLNQKRHVTQKIAAQGRFKGLRYRKDGMLVDATNSPPTALDITQADMWMVDPAVRSTTSAPTPDNLEDSMLLAGSLGVLNLSNWQRTCFGSMCRKVRMHATQPSNPSPFSLSLEAVPLLAALLEADGLTLHHILDLLLRLPHKFTKQSVWMQLPTIYETISGEVSKLRLGDRVIAQCKGDIEPVLRCRGQKAESPGGVLEHRTVPRLEWLVDFGCLHKSPNALNSSEYERESDCDLLRGYAAEMISASHRLAAADAAARFYAHSLRFDVIRQHCATLSLQKAIASSYMWLKPPIGSVPVKILCMCASLLCVDTPLPSYVESFLMKLSATDSRAHGSGGHYNRHNENIQLDRSLVDEWLAL